MEFINDKIRLILDDSRNALNKLESDTIDLVVTSPPYDNIRTYGDTLEWNFEIFKEIANELYRAVKKGGVVVWVVGDATISGSETGTSFRQALYFKEIGFNLHDTMIYQKATPPLTHNRYEQSFEYMFIFSKGKPSTFNGLRVPKKYVDNRKVKTFVKNKDNGAAIGQPNKCDTTLKTNVWNIFAGGGSGDCYSSQHPAPFPERLAEDHILSWSNENDTILDPFMGSGTTGKMAIKNKRKFIGVEKVENYYDISKQRILKELERPTVKKLI